MQKAGARSYVARLAELAPQYGFGFVERKVKPPPAVNAAAYLSSYFVKGRRGKATPWESAQSAAMPRSIVHMSVRLTQETGCTMRLLRFARFVWVLWGRCGCRDRSFVWRARKDSWRGLNSLRSKTQTAARLWRVPARRSEHGRTAAEGRTDGRSERGSATPGRPPPASAEGTLA
jgi:hypothetical protein